MQGNKDMEIRRYRRSQERLKSKKEREIIRVHKHKKTESKAHFEDPNRDSQLNMYAFVNLKMQKFLEVI